MLRETLRAATRLQHERIEQRLAIADRVRCKPAYVRLLERNYGIYAPLETRIGHFTREFALRGLNLSSRHKTPWIESDLRVLRFTTENIRAIPLCVDLPNLPNLSCALGCLYVLEGATLGGQVLLRCFKEAFGLDAGSGARFFSGYGRRTGMMWKSFVAFVNAQESTDLDTGEVIASARATFECFEGWMVSEPDVSPPARIDDKGRARLSARVSSGALR